LKIEIPVCYQQLLCVDFSPSFARLLACLLLLLLFTSCIAGVSKICKTRTAAASAVGKEEKKVS